MSVVEGVSAARRKNRTMHVLHVCAQVVGAAVDSVANDANGLAAMPGSVIGQSCPSAEGLAAVFAHVRIGFRSHRSTCRTE